MQHCNSDNCIYLDDFKYRRRYNYILFNCNGNLGVRIVSSIDGTSVIRTYRGTRIDKDGTLTGMRGFNQDFAEICSMICENYYSDKSNFKTLSLHMVLI